MDFFLCNKHKKAIKPTIHQNSAVSKTFLGKILKSLININFKSWNYCIPHRHRLLGQASKQPLSNFEPKKPWKYKQLLGLRPDPSCL